MVCARYLEDSFVHQQPFTSILYKIEYHKMRNLHQVLILYCQLILVSFILYSSIRVTATPLSAVEQHKPVVVPAPHYEVPAQQVASAPTVEVPGVVKHQKPDVKPLAYQSHSPIEPVAIAKSSQQQPGVVEPAKSAPAPVPVPVHAPVPAKAGPSNQPLMGKSIAPVASDPVVQPSKSVVKEPVQHPIESSVAKQPVASPPNVVAIKAPESQSPVIAVVKQQEVSDQQPVKAVHQSPVVDSSVASSQAVVSSQSPQVVPVKAPVVEPVAKVNEPVASVPVVPAFVPVSPINAPAISQKEPPKRISQGVLQVPFVKPAVHEAPISSGPGVAEPIKPIIGQVPAHAQNEQIVVPAVAFSKVISPVSSAKSPAVKGGLGPLHLLAHTLCSYQQEKLVADENLNLLYSQRAALRRSLFDFMSLKFTNLEKLSSRLNSGFASLEVVPPKKSDQSYSPGLPPSHGWPVVGVCTAHDLKLMAEAAWCDSSSPSVSGTSPANSAPGSVAQVPPVPSGQVSPSVAAAPVVPVPSSQQQVVSPQQQQLDLAVAKLDAQEPKIVSNQHQRARSLDLQHVQLQQAPPTQVVPSADQSSVISKILQVNDVRDAPVIESSLANLNLTQQQLVSLKAAQEAAQAQSNAPRECRRNALRLTKALFNHLAEDQKEQSSSWPQLHAQLSGDECARKRMIDVVTALAGFRGEATSIRRDNVEYAFAMDDLRTKVLESEVNVPLTFDKQIIEVEQFLQQSVKLMLANIDPERARLTSMRYRSLMPGPVAADDQCIELHQRLLAKNYPTDCNPNQFGQLPDVLRMAANSLALWSIENELAKYSSKFQEYPSVLPVAAPQVKEDVNECIANLVSS